MAPHYYPLDHVKVAAPCSASWEQMVGNDRIRFCEDCQLNVYNLSGMSKKQAEMLIGGAEGRLCVRFYRRTDGTILTSNCPLGLRAIRRRVSRWAHSMISMMLSFFAGVGTYAAVNDNDRSVNSIRMGVMVEPARVWPPPVSIYKDEVIAIAGELAPYNIEEIKPTPRRMKKLRKESGR